MIGEFIGDYQVTELLGEGGMGMVYKGVHRTLGQVVAIKMLHPQLTKDEKIKKRFIREAQALAKLNHPNMVQLINFINTPERCFIVMEFTKGKTLEDILVERGLIHYEQALEWFVGVLSAMAYAHSLGIIHRDIKPSNVMVLDAGGVKVLDFGTAKILGNESQEALTRAGMTLGTVIYMSPEQLLGRNLDHRSDLYSLGVTLYELCTGKLPFYHEEEFELIKMIAKEQPQPPSVHYPPIPPQLEQIILKAMAKRPEDRYQTAEEFLYAIKEFQKTVASGAVNRTMPQIARSEHPALKEVEASRSDIPEKPGMGTGTLMIIVGGVAVLLGLVVGALLIAAGQVVPGVLILALGTGAGVLFATYGFLVGGEPAAAPAEASGTPAPVAPPPPGAPLVGEQTIAHSGPQVTVRQCPECGRNLLPQDPACPFCHPDVVQAYQQTMGVSVPQGGAPAGGPPVQQVAPAAVAPPYAGGGPVATAALAYLCILDGPEAGRQIPVGDGAITLGRGPTNSVVMQDSGVSTAHCQIGAEGGRLVLTDLGSRNGSWVNNRRVQKTFLNDRDVIVLGSTRIAVQMAT